MVYIYIYIYTYTNIYTYLSLCRKRESERKIEGKGGGANIGQIRDEYWGKGGGLKGGHWTVLIHLKTIQP